MPSKRTKVSTAAQHKGDEPLEKSSNDGEPEKEASVYTTAEPQQGQSSTTWYFFVKQFHFEGVLLKVMSSFA